jgi:hypothetical protein
MVLHFQLFFTAFAVGFFIDESSFYGILHPKNEMHSKVGVQKNNS